MDFAFAAREDAPQFPFPPDCADGLSGPTGHDIPGAGTLDRSRGRDSQGLPEWYTRAL